MEREVKFSKFTTQFSRQSLGFLDVVGTGVATPLRVLLVAQGQVDLRRGRASRHVGIEFSDVANKMIESPHGQFCRAHESAQIPPAARFRDYSMVVGQRPANRP